MTVAMCATALLASCSDDDDNSGGGGTTPPPDPPEEIEGIISLETSEVFGEPIEFTLTNGVRPLTVDPFTEEVVDVTDKGLESVDYIGAFGGDGKDDGWEWGEAWINFEPENADYSQGEIVEVEGNITEDVNWTVANRYLIKGNVYVQDGVTVTIEAGTIVMGDKLTKGALVFNRGSKIMAEGTADNPIIFTSAEPAGGRARGDWGGVVICGKAITNKGTDATIEGISAAEGDNGKYGGTDAADNSGVLTYARIEFAGIALSPDNELNSLTMGSVGSGTEIHHIMVSFAGDDAFEWFGGSVNHTYMIAYNTLDDDFDTDAGYNGTLQFGYVLRDARFADISGSRGFEASSSSSDAPPTSAPVFSNFTLIGPRVLSETYDPNYKHGIRADKSSSIETYNTIVAGFPTGLENNGGKNPVFSGIVLTDNETDYVGLE